MTADGIPLFISIQPHLDLRLLACYVLAQPRTKGGWQGTGRTRLLGGATVRILGQRLDDSRIQRTERTYEESERIAYRTGLYVIHFKRAKYADSSDTLRGVVTAPAPGDVFDSVSGRTRYDASFIAKVVADKVENAIPLERQARMFGNERLPVAPSTLEDLYKRTADALQPLYERMVDRIMQCDILHADETFIKLMAKGAKKCKQAYLWCRLTGVGPPMTAYHFSPSRSRDVAESLLGDYSGTIIRDSYVAYEKLDCEVACCWAHARRRFLQAVENGYGKAEPLLKIIQELYQIEREAKARAEKK